MILWCPFWEPSANNVSRYGDLERGKASGHDDQSSGTRSRGSSREEAAASPEVDGGAAAKGPGFWLLGKALFYGAVDGIMSRVADSIVPGGWEQVKKMTMEMAPRRDVLGGGTENG